MSTTAMDRTLAGSEGNCLITRAGVQLRLRTATLGDLHGFKTLRCIQSRADHSALGVERALGFHARDFAGDPGVLLLEACLV